MTSMKNLSRRHFLTSAGLLTAGALLPKSFALAQSRKIRVGLMLPYTGTYAQLGVAITNGFKLAAAERGGKLSGRELEHGRGRLEDVPVGIDVPQRALVGRRHLVPLVVVGSVHPPADRARLG